jgi:cytochrome bd-type quinol oxidase subunit 2
MTLELVLPVVWFGVIGFGVLMYVLLDGFVLGLGILAPFAEDEAQLDHMMNTAAPIWDGNETWLVLGGAGLLAAFPKAYALVLSALYLPVLLMLLLALASLWAWGRGWMVVVCGRARWRWQGSRLLSAAGVIALVAGW